MVVESRRIIQLIKINGNIPSENYLYRPKRYKGFYKDSNVRKYQEEIIEKANSLEEVRKILQRFSLTKAMLEIDFFIKKSFWRRDTTNMVKATEDAISRITGVDDAMFVSVSSSKYVLPKDMSMETIIIVLTMELSRKET